MSVTKDNEKKRLEEESTIIKIYSEENFTKHFNSLYPSSSITCGGINWNGYQQFVVHCSPFS